MSLFSASEELPHCEPKIGRINAYEVKPAYGRGLNLVAVDS